MGAFIKLPAIKEIDSEQNQQAMHNGTHYVHFPIFRLRENREIACWWQTPNPL
jgi:hypothetical protein